MYPLDVLAQTHRGALRIERDCMCSQGQCMCAYLNVYFCTVFIKKDQGLGLEIYAKYDFKIWLDVVIEGGKMGQTKEEQVTRT